MLIALGIILFIVGCCVSSYEDNAYESQIRADKRHRELMRVLSESKEVAPRKTKRTQRRIAKDKEGNVLAEEIIEEVEQ